MMDSDFERAWHQAGWNRVVSFVTGKPSLLLPFSLVRDALGVESGAYDGIREIPLDRIIGSVNRYHDFDRHFLPRRWALAERWSHVRRSFDEEPGFAPIGVYQVGDAYFVLDGNHRVSVARQLGMKAIEAEVIVFRTGVPFDEHADFESLLGKAEYSEFLRRTRLDERRLGARVEFSNPGGYAKLLQHIDVHRYYIGLNERRSVSYDEAVVSWYDHLYRPLTEIFREEHLLESFPGRTEADLYVWVAEHLYYLREEFGEDVQLSTAVRDFMRMRKVPAWVKWVSDLEGRMRGVESVVTWREDRRETTALRRVAERLAKMKRAGVAGAYRVPQLWVEPYGHGRGVVDTDAIDFWREAVDRVLRSPREDGPQGGAGEWTRRSVVYNAFIRAAAAFDHDGDGALVNVPGRPRETGTFLKSIALLPYLRSLGCNVVHLLPIAPIGRDGRKGSLGSPYAILDPYGLDETLSEPLLGLGAETELRAFVEAAHRLGMRVVVEFVFRTAAKDSAWVPQHPDWFYWIRAGVGDRPAGSADESLYGSPIFSAEELERIKDQVGRRDFHALPPPHAEYRALFAAAPAVGAIHRESDRFVGAAADRGEVRIPGAFADWPPDDTQPPWSDVTYLRLYGHPDFDYIAYNTVRMYDDRLTAPELAVSALWERVVGILPHYVREYGIDGAMIDMGHALPLELKRRIIEGTRESRSDFAFWDEDFALRDESRNEGYNAAIGSLWWTIHRPGELRDALLSLARVGPALPFFATPETHNTPRCAARAGGAGRSRCAWILGCFLPAVPFVHGGFELGETQPVNTGLDFTTEELARFPTEALPLTAPWAYDWSREPRVLDAVRRSLDVRGEFLDLVTRADPESFLVPEGNGSAAVAYVRRGPDGAIVVVGNPSDGPAHARMTGLPLPDGPIGDRLSGRACEIRGGGLDVELAPWECLVFTWHDEGATDGVAR